MTSAYLKQLLTTRALREGVLRDGIAALAFPEGSRGLDAGCGAGVQCLLLAEAVGPNGRITGVDSSPEFIAYGHRLVAEAGLQDRISLVESDIAAMPFDRDTFDWAWSVDCVGYGRWDPMPCLAEMQRVIRPGGTLALLAWSSERLIPGYPLLEARLQGTSAGMAPFADGDDPANHLHRSLGLLRRAGLADVRATTVVGTVHAPLEDEIRGGLESLFHMRWSGAEGELSREDQAAYARLCRPDSRECVLRLPDYMAFFTYSIFLGTVS